MRDPKDHAKSTSALPRTLRVGQHDSLEIERTIVQRLQPSLIPYGVKTEELVKAVQKALKESGRGEAKEQNQLFSLVLYKLFVRNSPLWVSPCTPDGVDVPLDLLVAAYAIWSDAELFAQRHRVDAAAAAEALVDTTYATAEGLIRNDSRDSAGEEIGDLKNYLFKGYMHLISAIEKKLGAAATDYVDLTDWLLEKELSDMGDCLEALENGLFCREFLDAMPREGRSAAVARYILGYSWEETAEALGTSVNAAQKALSAGVRTAAGMYLGKMKKSGRQEWLQAGGNVRRRQRKISR
jgi:DNA-directed RNA polymerase specialized sigma24 family protein